MSHCDRASALISLAAMAVSRGLLLFFWDVPQFLVLPVQHHVMLRHPGATPYLFDDLFAFTKTVSFLAGSSDLTRRRRLRSLLIAPGLHHQPVSAVTLHL